MTTETPIETIEAWRPQRFGRRSAAHVEDPLVEPVWEGIRVLAHATPQSTRFVEDDGTARPWPDITRHMVDALNAESAILDGYIAPRIDPAEIGAFPTLDVEVPRMRDIGRRLFGFGNDRKRKELEALQAIERPPPLPPEATVEFVAVDLLSVDGELLLDIPLLERKRLLDGVLADAPLIRRGMHVRPPIGMWVATWKSLGFRAIAYKGANSRYVPGKRNDDWALAPIPVR
jgi:ATP-dependent DNA ligase